MSFSVLQWNVLADGLSDAFPLVQPALLTWDFRRTLFIDEIMREQPDVVCLQECDHFHDFFLPEMQKHGYTGVFKAKVNGVDGCAIFYKTDRFEATAVHLEDYRSYDVVESPDMRQVMAIVVLQVKATGGVVCVGTTHLKAKAEHEPVRVLQATVMLDILKRMRECHPSIPIVIAGDFNAEPGGPAYNKLITVCRSAAALRICHSQRRPGTRVHHMEDSASQ